MSSSLLHVKFFVPQLRPDLVARADLVARLLDGLKRPLTLISAPAGFGKTTLAAELARLFRTTPRSLPSELQSSSFSWLALDAADNDAARFWTYFVAALEQGETGETPFSELLALLQSEAPPSPQVLVDHLSNTIIADGRQRLLVLDDYHLIQSHSIHESLFYLLDHIPPNLRLVIATRIDPPLPLSRLRARGQLSEFRAADLRFSVAEAGEFLKRATGFEIPQEDLQTVDATTDGWAAGLQMAALALQSQLARSPALSLEERRRLVRDFFRAFSGKHVFVLDYLAEEVFNHQPEPVKLFLLHTSVLERLCAGLCDTLLEPGEEPAASAENSAPDSQALLEHLERANLFLAPLDSQRQWYRYHHLFADLLRARLRQAFPQLAPRLHLRASHWYEENGFVDEAIHHALAAEDWDRTAELVERNIQGIVARGQLSTVMKWIEALPEGLPVCRPRLCLELAWALSYASQIRAVPALLQAAENALDDWENAQDGSQMGGCLQLDFDRDEVDRLRGSISLIRSYLSLMSADPVQALVHALAAEERLPHTHFRERAFMNWMAGYASREMGQLDTAETYLQTAVGISQQAGVSWFEMLFLNDLAIVYRLRGKLARAEALYREALGIGEALNVRSHGYLSRVESGLSASLLDRNDLEGALVHARNAVDWLKWWPSPNHAAQSYALLGQALLAAGDIEGAAQALEQADQARRQGPVLPMVHPMVESRQVRLWIVQGDLAAAQHWFLERQEDLQRIQSTVALKLSEADEIWLMTLARLRMAQANVSGEVGAFDEALRLLERAAKSARAVGRVSHLMEIIVLQSVVLYLRAGGRNETASQAFAKLQNSLALSAPEGYVRLYLNEGRAMQRMLHEMARRLDTQSGGTPDLGSWIGQLLSAFPGQQAMPAGFGDSNALVESLTEREREVLGLLSQGLSNREMADELFVTEGTIKTHVHNLLSKLGAQNRTHAIAMARDLNLL